MTPQKKKRQRKMRRGNLNEQIHVCWSCHRTAVPFVVTNSAAPTTLMDVLKLWAFEEKTYEVPSIIYEVHGHLRVS